MSGVTIAVCGEVANERHNQDERWGEQNHDSLYDENQRRQFEHLANRWKRINDARVVQGRPTWDGILLEEVYEALAESDLPSRRAELLQVAAVAVAEVEEIDRRLGIQAAINDMLEQPEVADALDQ